VGRLPLGGGEGEGEEEGEGEGWGEKESVRIVVQELCSVAASLVVSVLEHLAVEEEEVRGCPKGFWKGVPPQGWRSWEALLALPFGHTPRLPLAVLMLLDSTVSYCLSCFAAPSFLLSSVPLTTSVFLVTLAVPSVSPPRWRPGPRRCCRC